MDAYWSLLHQLFYDILSVSYDHRLVRQSFFLHLTVVLSSSDCIDVLHARQ